jgi:FMN phosphatase YigB (HAD superfamily)
MPPHSKGCLLFDWGDTLMRDLKEFNGPMKDWPRLQAVPGAAGMLAALSPDWTLALATNAVDSDEADIRAALQRVGLNRWIDRVYCARQIGHRKPSFEFYLYIMADLELAPRSIWMIGDNYETDVAGAITCGLRAIWFNEHSLEERGNDLHRTIHALVDLPAVLEDLM